MQNTRRQGGFVLGASVVLGIGLIALWMIGLAQGGVGWLLWLDLLAAILSIAGGVAASEERAPAWTRAGTPGFMAIVLGAMWIVALATGVTAWKTWWTFAFACAYAVTSISIGVESRESGVAMHG
jgi:hypothetical protein